MLQMESDKKLPRILTIYKLLMDGDIVNKGELAKQFGVNERSIQRDIEDIRSYFSEKRDVMGGNFLVIYDHKRKGYRLEGESKKMSGGEFLAVCKILLESRAFTRTELEPILEKLIYNCAPPSEQKQAKELIANERYHYIEPHHHTEFIKLLWELGTAVRKQQYVKLWYRKLKEDRPVARLVKPVGIMFSEYYFYLIAFIEREETMENSLSPAIYRVDRIQSLCTLEQHFSVPYKDRFEEGEFRKRVQFMFGGRLQRIVFEYTGLSVEAVLDRLPTAEIIEERAGTDGKKIYTIRAEVFGDGIDMWMRSQGDALRVLSRKIID